MFTAAWSFLSFSISQKHFQRCHWRSNTVCTIFSYYVKYAFPCFKTDCKSCHLKNDTEVYIFISLVTFSLMRQIVPKFSLSKKCAVMNTCMMTAAPFSQCRQVTITSDRNHGIEEEPFIDQVQGHSSHTWQMQHLGQGQPQNTQQRQGPHDQHHASNMVVIITITARTTATTISQASTAGQVLRKYHFYSLQLLQIRGYSSHGKHEEGWNACSPNGLHQGHASSRVCPSLFCPKLRSHWKKVVG